MNKGNIKMVNLLRNLGKKSLKKLVISRTYLEWLNSKSIGLMAGKREVSPSIPREVRSIVMKEKLIKSKVQNLLEPALQW